MIVTYSLLCWGSCVGGLKPVTMFLWTDRLGSHLLRIEWLLRFTYVKLSWRFVCGKCRHMHTYTQESIEIHAILRWDGAWFQSCCSTFKPETREFGVLLVNYIGKVRPDEGSMGFIHIISRLLCTILMTIVSEDHSNDSSIYKRLLPNGESVTSDVWCVAISVLWSDVESLAFSFFHDSNTRLQD
jgi:hypothetical protein